MEKRIAFDEERERRFEDTLAKYPKSEAALLPALWLAQEQFGYLPDEVVEYVARRVGVSSVRAFAVVEFYTMLKREPTGRFHLQLCRNLSCSLLGSESLEKRIEEKLGIVPGGKTSDGTFSLELVECLGSCGTAPVMRINDTYYENLDLARLDRIIEACREGSLPQPEEL